MAERNGLCPGWRRSLLGKGTGLPCSRAPGRRHRPSLSCAPRKACRLAGIRDHLGSTLAMLREVRRRADNFDIVHFHVDLLPQALFHDLAHKCLVTLHGRLDLRSSKASATNLSPPESQSSSLSSPSPASSSLSSTRYCEIDAHGSKSPLDGQDSRSLIQPAQSVS
jgi:hypothetical protein